MSAAPIEPWLREILRCPACRGPLADAADSAGVAALDCAGACAGEPEGRGRRYRIEDGIPVLLLDEASTPPPGDR